MDLIPSIILISLDKAQIEVRTKSSNKIPISIFDLFISNSLIVIRES